MMKRGFLLAQLCLCAWLTGYGQSGKLFAGDLELSNSLVRSVFQDSKGNIWAATEDGLNRFDGSKFTIYKHIPKDPHSLLNNYVRLVFEDREGHLLVGFYNGLQWFDHATESFEQIPLNLLTGGRFNAHILTAVQRKNGDLLIGTAALGTFILRFNAGKPEAHQVSHKIIPGGVVECLFEDSREYLWVTTQDKGLFVIAPDGKIKSYASGNVPRSPVAGICEDRDGNVYIGSASNGLFVYDNKTDAFRAIPYAPVHNLPIEALELSKHDDEIYIGTDGHGMKIYDLKKKVIQDANFNVTTFDFEHAKIHCVLEDRSGNLWLGIFQKGVMLLPSRSSNFSYTGYKSVKNNTIGSNAVLSILEDREGTRWVGTDSDGLYAITATGERKAHYQHTADPSSVPATVMCIFEDSEQNLWLGSYLNGLAKFNRRTGKCEYVKTLLDHNSDHANNVFSIVEDDQKNLWVGTMGAGLFSMNLKTGFVKHYDVVPPAMNRGDQNALHNSWINCLLVTKEKKIYIGSYDGLGCLDLKNQSFVSTFGANKLLASHIVYSLFEDNHGTIWLGTSQGLMYLDKTTGGIRVYTMDDGLPSNVVCAVRGDDQNNLWISTNYGVSKFNPTTNTFVNYNASDGLQGNEFCKTSAFVNPRGEIFFGGINGLTSFRPAEISDTASRNNTKPEVRITGFYIHDRSIRKGTQSGGNDIIDKAVMDATEFRLAHNDNTFSIELSTLEFANLERITYRYALEDDSLTKLRPGTNTVTFNDLPPGTYRFRVQAESSNNISDLKEVSIIISPIWYLSAFAKAVYLLLLIATGVLLVLHLRNRQRAREKRRADEQAKKINEAKLQFFLNISHEIRTPMSLIISPLKKLRSADKDAERQKAYGTMERNSERILHLINQLMDVGKIDQGQLSLKFREVDMVDFVQGVCSIFDEQSKSKDITLRFNAEPSRIPAWVDDRHFDKTIINVLSNAFKFTPGHGTIDVVLRTGEDNTVAPPLNKYFEIAISDTGIGIAEGEKEKIFECFYQVKHAHNHFVEGTGIGLNLTKSIIDLHYGNIWVDNRTDGTGCRFVMRLPLGKEHLKGEDLDTGRPITPHHDVAPAAILSATDEETTEHRSKTKTRNHILVIEDDPEIQKYISEELGTDYHICQSVNGKEGLAAALAKIPDLIISDVMMPEMDGITLCRKVKQNVNINHIPVILLTAKANDEDNLQGLGIGADAYMVKPFNIEILKKTVEAIIRNREMLRNSFSGNQQQKDKVKKVEMKSADEKLLARIVDVINANIGNPDFNVEMMSAEIGISRVHLHRKMKELTNQSTRDFIRNVRLKQAALLLSGKHQNISDVAYATGFTALAVFSTAFKEFYGVSPREYMQSHHTQPAEDLDGR